MPRATFDCHALRPSEENGSSTFHTVSWEQWGAFWPWNSDLQWSVVCYLVLGSRQSRSSTTYDSHLVDIVLATAHYRDAQANSGLHLQEPARGNDFPTLPIPRGKMYGSPFPTFAQKQGRWPVHCPHSSTTVAEMELGSRGGLPHQKSKGFVDRLVTRKRGSYIRREFCKIGPFAASLQVLSANATP